MERKEALKALITAGRSKEVRSYIMRRAEVAQERYAAIRGDESMSDKARRYQLAVGYLSIRDDADRYLDTEARKVTRTDRDDAARVFGTMGISGDAASLVISRRDASDRVAAVESEAELRELLDRATRTGDEVLARAVAERATEEQKVNVMNAFLEDRPRLQEAGERLWNAKRASTSDGFGMTLAMYELLPQELNGVSQAEIENIAADPPAPASSSPSYPSPGVPILDASSW